MSATYKVAYEHNDGTTAHAEELFLTSDSQLTVLSPEVSEAVSEDTARFHKAGSAGFRIISVVAVP